MPELRLQIPDEVAKKLVEDVGGSYKITDITRDALTLFNWAVQETAKGRVVLSTDKEGGNVKQLVMPSLENVPRREK